MFLHFAPTLSFLYDWNYCILWQLVLIVNLTGLRLTPLAVSVRVFTECMNSEEWQSILK